MRITLMASGSRGDVQPFIALGKRLRSAGHEVLIAAPKLFETFITSHGIAYHSIAGSPQEAIEKYNALIAAGKNPVQAALEQIRVVQEMNQHAGYDLLEASENADAIVCLFNLSALGYSIAEKLQLPFFECGFYPTRPTSSYPNPEFYAEELQWWPSALNRQTHHIVDQIMWHPHRNIINSFRRDVLRLPPFPLTGPMSQLIKRHVPRLDGYSRHLFSANANWGQDVYVTGFWFLDDGREWQPSPELSDFLADGEPPVYIGFGSMTFGNPAERAEIALDALKKTGQRGLLATGWGGIQPSDLPDNVFLVDSVPHDWLFPRVSAVVHHGGAGTTAAGIRAGVPMFIVTFMSDQPFWGRIVEKLGIGPAPIPRKKLNVEPLTQAIETLTTNQSMKQRAAALGAKIRTEDGIGSAVEIITRFTNGHDLDGAHQSYTIGEPVRG